MNLSCETIFVNHVHGGSIIVHQALRNEVKEVA